MKYHPYHLVDISPWPILISLNLLTFTLSLISYILYHSIYYFLISLILNIFIGYLWWRDIIREGKKGDHTKIVQNGLFIGFNLFLISEFMLFFSLFWTFFHASLSPSIELGHYWPPIGINYIDYKSIPLLGSTLLLSAGFLLTLSHHNMILGNKYETLKNLLLTIILSTLFIILQLNEYYFSEFNYSDSIFGSIFYLTTGLHGLHVLIGVLFLIVSFIRILFDELTSEHHLGFEFSIYYFHFVDIIWLFVYLVYYWWGN